MISQKAFSAVLFLQRILFALALAFLAMGEFLHLNAFVQNGIDIGLPYARIICTAAVICSFLAALGILLGFFFRTTCFLAILVCLFSGFFFFAGGINKVNVVGVLLALTILCGFLFMGGGKITLDYYLQQKKINNNKRIDFR